MVYLAAILYMLGGAIPPATFGATTIWTGADDDIWHNPDNWTHGVPDADTGAIFNDQAQVFSIQSPGGTDSVAAYLLFTAELGNNPITVSAAPNASYLRIMSGDSITVQAGAPAVTLTSTSSRNVRFTRGETSYIRNHSDNLLRFLNPTVAKKMLAESVENA